MQITTGNRQLTTLKEFDWMLYDNLIRTAICNISPRGGGITLLVHGTGLCHFLGYLFHDRVRIYGYGFQPFYAFSGFLGTAFCKNSFIGELFSAFPDLWV